MKSVKLYQLMMKYNQQATQSQIWIIYNNSVILMN